MGEGGHTDVEGLFSQDEHPVWLESTHIMDGYSTFLMEQQPFLHVYNRRDSALVSGRTVSLLPPPPMEKSWSCRLSASVATARVSYLEVRERQIAASTNTASEL